MIFVLTLLFLSYFVLVIILIAGWNKAIHTPRESYTKLMEAEIKLSVVIAARNEEHSISNLLEDLSNQTYSLFEVIIVDDHSTDRTDDIVSGKIKYDNRFKIIKNTGHGKKKALTCGIANAAGEIIITTDADCRVQSGWIKSIYDQFKNDESLNFLFGGVKIEDTNTLFSSLQAIEFCSLIGTSAATMSLGFPSMCNGANLAFRKSVFNDVYGYADNLHIPSGDDEFLMRKIFKIYPTGVKFNSDRDAIVTTQPQRTLSDFIHQRLRWAGKWRYNRSASDMFLAVYIITFQLSVLLIPILVLTGFITIYFALALWIAKAALEYFFLKSVSTDMLVKWRWGIFFLLLILYPFYTVCIGILSNFKSFTWKGRNLKSINQTTM